jgi:NADH:ubiquinone oxidoreductase subunit 4 (subunit M)
VNVVGFIVIYLCYFVGAVSLAVLGDRFWSNSKGLPLAFLYFPLVISLLCRSSSFFTLFVSYELLLVPSLFVVYKSCYTRRAQQANIYFFVWTQLGSLVAVCPVLYLLFVYKNTSFLALSAITFTKRESWVLFMLFFIGFGVKVPVWPLHYWLIKIHVEAPSGFSIFLSGFWLKQVFIAFLLRLAFLNLQVFTFFQYFYVYWAY